MISLSLAKHGKQTLLNQILKGSGITLKSDLNTKMLLDTPGGITILAKHNIQPGLKSVQNSEEFLWIRLEKSFFNLENEIFLCVAYIPPKNATQNILSKTDYFDSLENSIFNYKDKGNIVIMGDHAGTGIEDHTLCLDNHISQRLPDTNSTQDGDRCSCDDKTNSYGRILLKLCNNHNLKIANWQTPGDRVGNYKCFNRGGASVADYLLVENSIHQKVENLKTLPPEFDSKHTSITATFRIKTINNSIGKLLNPPKTYMWNSRGATMFSSLINCKDYKMKIKTISEALERNKSVQNIQKATKTFTEFITNCANESLKIKRPYKANKKHSKSWYNETFSQLKKQFKQASNLL